MWLPSPPLPLSLHHSLSLFFFSFFFLIIVFFFSLSVDLVFPNLYHPPSIPFQAVLSPFLTRKEGGKFLTLDFRPLVDCRTLLNKEARTTREVTHYTYVCINGHVHGHTYFTRSYMYTQTHMLCTPYIHCTYIYTYTYLMFIYNVYTYKYTYTFVAHVYICVYAYYYAFLWTFVTHWTWHVPICAPCLFVRGDPAPCPNTSLPRGALWLEILQNGSGQSWILQLRGTK